MGRQRRSRQGTGRRCAAEGCERFVQAGRVLCPSHARGAYGQELEAAIGRMARQVEQAFRDGRELGHEEGGREQAASRQRAVMEAFRWRVERGEYGELFEGRLRAVMAQATAERGVAEEIGALRVVLARLLTDERLDAETQARYVARVVGMTVRAVKVQREIAGSAGDPVSAEMWRVLESSEHEREERRLVAQSSTTGEWKPHVDDLRTCEATDLSKVISSVGMASSGTRDRWTETE